MISPVKGTRDFYPDDQARHRWLAEIIREVSESFGYLEYEAPHLERLDLYSARSGEELVREQSFVFQDRGGEWIVLRPELTPSLARMVAMRRQSLIAPIRWWSFGPFWRYERPQKGRTREFWQWNIDQLGIDSPWADAELISIAAAFFRRAGVGPDQVRILVNNRRLVDAQLTGLSIPRESQAEVLRWIDRADKMPPGRWREGLTETGLSALQIDGLLSLLEEKEAWQSSPELAAAFQALESLGGAEYAEYSASVVRGLDYYTGTVFEARDVTGTHRAILGGGRYDNLVQEVGGEPLPGVGFAMGDVVLRLLLDDLGIAQATPASPAQVLVLSFPDVPADASAQLASELRGAGLRVEWYPSPDRVPKQLKHADRMGIPVAAILGPQEQSQGQVTLKDLRSGLQQTTPRPQAASTVRDWLAKQPSR